MQRRRPLAPGRGAGGLLVLSVYPEDQAGTRLRAHAFQPDFESAGLAVAYWSFLSLRDSQVWFTGASRTRRLLILCRSAQRLLLLPRLVARAGVVLVLREVLPIASPVVERWAGRRARLVWDVDDAIWTEYPRLFFRWVPRRLRRTPEKYVAIAGAADEVWAGSELLADWCRQHSSNVVVVPTSVSVPESVVGRTDRRRTAGWIGSPSTAPFLEQVLPDVLAATEGEVVACVGGQGALTADGVDDVPWSLAAEEDLLTGVRVGLYPVDPAHPLASGKAGLKAVLYMAHGLPCVVTPTAAIAAIVRDGVDGLHASTPEQWRIGVARLLHDDALWDRLAQSGLARVREQYSTAVWGPRLAARLLALTAGAH
jgi:hypothetical protein